MDKSLILKAPLDKVWVVWMDVEKNHEWMEGVKQSSITGGKPGPGLRWSENCIFLSKLVPMEHKMVICEERKKTVIRTELPLGASLERIVEFRETSEGTEVTAQIEWNLGIAASFVDEDALADMLEKNFELTVARWEKRALAI